MVASLGNVDPSIYPVCMSIANPPRVSVTFQAKKVTVEDAKRYGIDIPSLCEQALHAEVGRRWQEENREAIEASNVWLEEHGLPYKELRLF